MHYNMSYLIFWITAQEKTQSTYNNQHSWVRLRQLSSDTVIVLSSFIIVIQSLFIIVIQNY